MVGHIKVIEGGAPTGDLFYFQESKMNEGIIKTFYNKLPSKLKQHFLNSVPNDLDAWDSEIRVLQGYKGPFPNGGSADSQILAPRFGLQEVRYWWGPAERMYMFWGLSQLVNSHWSQWFHLYFDENTGECLSHDLEEAAAKLNNKGQQLFANGKYDEAKEYFGNACEHSNIKANWNDYKANENKAQAKMYAVNSQ
jgi:hypothetical protein